MKKTVTIILSLILVFCAYYIFFIEFPRIQADFIVNIFYINFT